MIGLHGKTQNMAKNDKIPQNHGKSTKSTKNDKRGRKTAKTGGKLPKWVYRARKMHRWQKNDKNNKKHGFTWKKAGGKTGWKKDRKTWKNDGKKTRKIMVKNWWKNKEKRRIEKQGKMRVHFQIGFILYSSFERVGIGFGVF